MNADIAETLARLDALMKRRDKLYAELKHSMALQHFWPEAFAHGACKSHVVGSPAEGYRFMAVRGNGSRREWPLAEVPRNLWPPEVEEHARRYPSSLKCASSPAKAGDESGTTGG